MAQITTTDANEFSSSAKFTPMRGFSNCHLQTMLPRLFRRKVKFTPYWQRLPSAIRSAVICWPVCWQKKAMISRLMRQ